MAASIPSEFRLYLIYKLRYKCNYGLETAILDVTLPVWSDSIPSTSVGLLDLKNIGEAVGISSLSCLQAAI